MPSDIDHNKIIKQAANSVLKPNGLFQKSSSRIWIDDNGWYLTVVEFQPSNWDKGTYLNVAVHFLWDEKDYLSFDYYIDDQCLPIHRVNGFIRFDGDADKFYSENQSLAEAAMKKVTEYRRFHDLKLAQRAILKHQCLHIIHTLYQKMMMCGLCHDPNAVSYFDELHYELLCSEIQWAKRYRTELANDIAPIIHNPELFFDYICKKIDRQRLFWSSKSSMKKMQKSFNIVFK